jgi:ABC-type multidrug transport system ATPase subunit
MIEARAKRHGDTTAAHSLSFTIAPGTITGILGPNGARKSTTMRMIMGLDRPTSGERANSLIKTTYTALRRYRGCPWRLVDIVGAALVLLHHENHRTTR